MEDLEEYGQCGINICFILKTLRLLSNIGT